MFQGLTEVDLYASEEFRPGPLGDCSASMGVAWVVGFRGGGPHRGLGFPARLVAIVAIRNDLMFSSPEGDIIIAVFTLSRTGSVR